MRFVLPLVDREKCRGCGKCKEMCPVDAIIFVDGKAYITVECVQMGCCIPVCPQHAISQEGYVVSF